MAKYKKALVFLTLNLGVVGWTFYYYLKGIPVAMLAIVISISALILNLVGIFVWRAASKRSKGENTANSS